MTGTAMIQTMVSVSSGSFNPGDKQSASADQSNGSFKDLLSDAGGQAADHPGRADAAGQMERPVKQEEADESNEKTPVMDDKDQEENAVLKETASILQSGVPGAETVVQPEELFVEDQPAALPEGNSTAVQDITITVKQDSSDSVWDMSTWSMVSRDMILKAGIRQDPAGLQNMLQGGGNAGDVESTGQDIGRGTGTAVFQEATDFLDAVLQPKESLTAHAMKGTSTGNMQPAAEGGQQTASMQETQQTPVLPHTVQTAQTVQTSQTVQMSQTAQADQAGHLQSMETQTQQATVKTQMTDPGVKSQEAGKAAGGQPDQAAQKDFTAQTPVAKAETQQQNTSQEDGAQTGTYSRSAADLKLDQLTRSAKQAETQDAAALQTAAEGGQQAQVETVTIKVAEPYEQGIRNLPKNLAEQIHTHMAAGKQEFIVQLAPEQLGRIAIRISTSDAGVKVLLSCENQKTMELLTQKASQIGQIVEHNTGSQTVVEVKEDNYWSQQKNPTDEHRNQNQGGQDQRRQDQDHGREESEDFIQQLRLGLYSYSLAAGL